MRARLLLIALSTFLPAVVAQSDEVCFGSTGNEDPSLSVCDPRATTSACCPFGHICYSNGLCQNPGVTSVNATQFTIYSVHGCTRNGASTGPCAPVARCLGRGVGVTVCGANTYCCYGLRSCNCNNATEVFTLSAGTILTTLPATQSTSSSSRSTSSTRTTSATTSPTSIGAASATTTPSASVSPVESSGSSNNSVAVGAGVGVGVGVALILLAGLAFFFWRRRHRRQKAASAAAFGSQPGMTGQVHSPDAKYGSATYSPVLQTNPDGPGSVTQPSELAATRDVSELQGSGVYQLPNGTKNG